MTISEASVVLKKLEDNIGKVIFGKSEAIRLLLITLICGEHILIEDYPGVGKTRLISALARSIKAQFSRIQFTPDIMPADVTGVMVFHPPSGEFRFRKGAAFAQIIMADELNRTPPRTQSSLLELMEEGQTTVDGVTYPMDRPFMVLATQNPLTFQGTYPLPEAQLDRFLMKISLGYPDEINEVLIIKKYGEADPIKTLEALIQPDEIITIQNMIPTVQFNSELNNYTASLIRATRNHAHVRMGASPRASIALARAARAKAVMEGRDYVIPDDIKELALPVLNHRIQLSHSAINDGIQPEEIIEEICGSIDVPVLT